MVREFTGRHMLAILVGGFGIVVAVNFTMASLASSTFGGVVVRNSYVASQKFNEWLDAAGESERLGWQVALARREDGRIEARTGGVPAGATVRAAARHPLGRMPDTALQFAPEGKDIYVSRDPLPAGRWTVRVEIARGGETWRGERPLP